MTFSKNTPWELASPLPPHFLLLIPTYMRAKCHPFRKYLLPVGQAPLAQTTKMCCQHLIQMLKKMMIPRFLKNRHHRQHKYCGSPIHYNKRYLLWGGSKKYHPWCTSKWKTSSQNSNCRLFSINTFTTQDENKTDKGIDWDGELSTTQKTSSMMVMKHTITIQSVPTVWIIQLNNTHSYQPHKQ